MCLETDIIKMLEFLIDNIFAMFGGRDFQLSNLSVISWREQVTFLKK
jgi:hypothetical protein